MARFPSLSLLFLLPAMSLAQTQQLPQHPRLLFDPSGIARLKQRAGSTLWSAQWERLRRDADRALTEKIDLPPRGSSWYHYYVCPTHGARPEHRQALGDWQWEHICPVDREVLRGAPSRPERDFDGFTLSGTHSRYAEAVRNNGLLFQLTGQPQYAARAREVLLAYAEPYLTYPLHDIHGAAKIGGGRLGPQTLMKPCG